MKNVLLVIFFCVVVSGCASYTMGGKKFTTKSSALEHQKTIYENQMANIAHATYFGGSMLIHLPTDENLSQVPFVTGNPSSDQLDYFLKFYKQDFESVKLSIEKSKMFDTTDLIQTSSYLRYAKNHGYRYLSVNNGDGSWTIYDLYLGEDKIVRFPKGLDNLVYLVEDTISKFEAKKPSGRISSTYSPSNERLSYDEATRKGFLSVSGKGIEARYWMLKKIGEIAATKNVALKSDGKPSPGVFTVLNEKIEGGVFTIEFETLY